MGKHKIVKSAAAVALTASVVATAAAPGASAASYKVNSKDQLVYSKSGKLVKGWKVFGGKLYKNGKLAPAKKYKIIGSGAARQLFYGPTLKKGYKTAINKTLLFKDGKLADGWKQAGKNERLYKNGKLDKGYTVYTDVEGEKFLYQNGYLKKGQKTATRGGETLLFVDGKLAKGYVLHEASKTLYNNGKVAKGLVQYPEKDGKFYNDGKLANGEINGAEYKDGVLVAKDIASVKAINGTTVEVTFKKDVDATSVKAEDYTIEGLTVTNAAPKQNDKKVVVLTTSAQEGGKEYLVKYGDDAKTFTGVSAVTPTAVEATSIKPYQTSQQAKIGQQVTVKATVTVAEGQSKAGIPVTFNIDAQNDAAAGNFGEDKKVEVFTDANGVASYSYTQYGSVDGKDVVTAYPTGAPNLRSETNVFWGVKQQPLTVTEATEGSVLANDGKKVYKVSAPEYKGKTVNVTFAENFNVTPDKVDYKAQINGVTPFQTQIAGKADAAKPVTVTLDSNGEATFTVTGANTTVTPVVFFDDVKTNVDGLNRLNKTELQVTAASVKFDNIKTVSLTNEAKGTSKASVSTKAVSTDANFSENVGGREFVATYTDEKGKLAPKGATVYVTFAEKESDKEVKLQGALRVFGENGAQAPVAFKDSVTGNNVYKLTVGDNGQVKYTVSSTVENNYATPITFLDNGSNKTNNTLDQYDTQAKAETTYFGDATVKTAVATYYHDKALTKPVDLAKDKIVPGTPVYVEYQTVDQNGLPYAPQDEKGNVKLVDVKFQFTTTFGNLTVKDAATGKTLGTVTGNTNNNEFVVSTDVDGEAVLELNTDLATTIKIQASGTPTIENTKVEDFTNYTGTATAKTVAQAAEAVNALTSSTGAAVEEALTGLAEFDKLTKAQKEEVVTSVKSKLATGKVTAEDITKAINDAKAPEQLVLSSKEVAAALNTTKSGSEEEVKAVLAKYPAFAKLSSSAQADAVAALAAKAKAGTATAAFVESTIDTVLATETKAKLNAAKTKVAALNTLPVTTAQEVKDARQKVKDAEDAVAAALAAGHTVADITDYVNIATTKAAIEAATNVKVAANDLSKINLTETSPIENITLTDDQALTAQLDIAKEGLVIDANGKKVTFTGAAHAFVIQAKNVTIKNATVTGATANSVYVQAPGATITGNTFENGGVNLFESAANTITLKDNAFKNMSVGILVVEDAGQNNISYNLSKDALKGFYNGNTFTLTVNSKFNGKVAVAGASDASNNFYYINDQGEVATIAIKVVTLP